MKKFRLVLCGTALACVAGLTGIASAQTSGLQNAGFETGCPFCGGPFADGWHSPGGDTIAKRRFVGDTFFPPLMPVGTPNAITPHSGNALQEVGTHGAGGFEGVTTDTVNYCYCDQTCSTACASPYPYFDPIFDYSGGDVVVTAWYMIPANDPISDNAGINIQIKVQNQPVASIENLSITGTTNGVWTPISLTFSRIDIQNHYECNRGIQPDCGCNCVPADPLPNHTKITLVRFVGDGTPSTGTIYWDDVTYTQLPAGPTCDTIDFNNDGLFPDTADIDDFLAVFSGGSCSNDPNCGDIDFNNDGLFPDTLDIDALLSVFSGGACLV